MSVFEKIKAGLEEAIAFEAGELEARTAVFSLSPDDAHNVDNAHKVGFDIAIETVEN